MLAFVGKNRDDNVTFPETLRNFESRAASGAGRNADEQSFFGCQAPGMVRRFFVANGYDFVENLAV